MSQSVSSRGHLLWLFWNLSEGSGSSFCDNPLTLRVPTKVNQRLQYTLRFLYLSACSILAKENQHNLVNNERVFPVPVDHHHFESQHQIPPHQARIQTQHHQLRM